MKKALVFILASLLVLSAFSVSAFAANPPVTEIEVPYKEAVIDGEVDGDEWDGATALTLNISDTGTWSGSGAGLVGDPDYAKKNHTDDDFTVTIKLMYKDKYMYLLGVRKDTTPYYGSQDYHRAYQQDGSLCWFFNEDAWGEPEVLSLFADATSEKNTYKDEGAFIVYAPENNQAEAAIFDGIEVKATLTDKGHVFEAKFPIADIGLTEADLAAGKIHFTFCSVNIYNPEYSGQDNLWSPNGYQAQYTGVNSWAAAPVIRLTGGTYETSAAGAEDTLAHDTEFKLETKAPATEAPKETKAPETKAPASTDAPKTEKSGCGSAVASLALVPMLLAAAYVCGKKH